MAKTRFCPSPTGYIHLGNTRTALFSALYAYSQSGEFLLRIEDTDQERSKEIYTQALKEDLIWLGLDWQDGPYWQSKRTDIYDKYYQQLEEQGQAYPCFCSESQLALSRKLQRAAGQPPRYAGTCRHLSKDEVQARLDKGEKPTLRFHIPEEIIEFEDFVRGPQRFHGKDIGDLIIRRADGTAAFMYSNAIDDSLMGVTHAMRGEDHLTNTPRQLWILQALGLRAPQYGHISMITGPDGSPLSKRHGSRSVKDLREMGYLPQAINNYLARLGHNYSSDKFMSISELAENFDLVNLAKSPARYDQKQLDYWQSEAVQQCDDENLWQWLEPNLNNLIPKDKSDLFINTIKSNITFPKDGLAWAEILMGELNYSESSLEILSQTQKEFYKLAIECINASLDYKNLTNILKEKLSIKGKQLFMPLRIALTGEKHGPELEKIIYFLGKDEVINRFNKAHDYANL